MKGVIFTERKSKFYKTLFSTFLPEMNKLFTRSSAAVKGKWIYAFSKGIRLKLNAYNFV